MKKILFYAFVFLLIVRLEAQNTLKMMDYNLLKFDETTDRKDDLKYILDSYKPDIFTVCELESEAASNVILNECLNHDDVDFYSAADFHLNESGYYTDLNQMLYYNHQKLDLMAQTYLQTSVRDINKYTLKVLTDDLEDSSVYIEVYVAHLKSSSGDDNEEVRAEMVSVFTDDLKNVPADHYVIFTGDFNIYDSGEPAYVELLDSTNAIVMVDPIDTPGNWHNNSSYASIHTQSTHEYGDDLFIGGGLDDRFDFIIISENIKSEDTRLNYVEDSYHAYGNNGTCFNQAITSSDCDGGTYDTTLRYHLYNMSDHLPVVMEMQVEQELSVTEKYCQGNYVLSGENPVCHYLQIEGEGSFPVTLKLYDVLGHQLALIKHYNKSPIDISHLKSGVYFVNVSNKNYSQLIKFVKAD